MTVSIKRSNQEIDFIELSEVLWSAKWFIIIFSLTFALLGYAFFEFKTKKYLLSSPLAPGGETSFSSYIPVNTLLQEAEPDYISFPKINSDYIFTSFIEEFNDSNEIMSIVSSASSVQDLVKDLNEKDKRVKIQALSKSFKIKKKKDNVGDVEYFFEVEWHNEKEGQKLLKNIIEKVINNVKKRLVLDIKNISSSIITNQEKKIIFLNNLLSNSKEAIDVAYERYFNLLKYHSKIARNLKIKKPVFQTNIENFINVPNTYLLDTNYYLRGFQSIDEELKVLSKLSERKKILLFDKMHEASGLTSDFNKMSNISSQTNSYHDILSRLNFIISFNRGEELRDFLPLIENGETKYWIKFNDKRIYAESKDNMIIYVILFSVFGFMIGSIMKLYSHAKLKRS